MDIKVYGMGCEACHQTYELVMNFLAEKGIEANLDYIQDPREIYADGITLTPAIVVDGVQVSSGKVPTRQELERWLAPKLEVDRWWTKKPRKPRGLKSI